MARRGSMVHRDGRFTLFFAKCAFSQHSRCIFHVDDLEFHSALHYMLYEKAKLLKGMDVAKSVLDSEDHRECYKLTDRLSDADTEHWQSACTDVIKKGNFAKFTQNDDKQRELFATIGTTLVYADSRDDLLGIGLHMDSRDAVKQEKWPGRNILGQVLTDIRDELLLRLQWSVGDQCLAVWSKDNKLYKAMIITLNEEKKVCQVKYEKYNDEEERQLVKICPANCQHWSTDEHYHQNKHKREKPDRHSRRHSREDYWGDDELSTSYAESDADETEKYTLFYTQDSPLSQWYGCRFTVDGIEYNCAEQYMMHQKALVFRDHETAERVMAAKRPMHQKQLGRQVKNYNEDEWNDVCKDVVKQGNIAKFSQNSYLKTILLETAGTVLAEASPNDTKWGIGYPADDPRAKRRKLWRGTNLLGQVLMEVRDVIASDAGTDISSLPVVEDAEEGYTLFWRSQSPFSQWHPAYFTIDDVTYNCAEQYMMYQKAVYFEDSEMAKKILQEKDPRQQKSLARNVINFDETEWNKVSQSVVKKGSLEKYRQNAHLRRELFATAHSVLVEASKDDCRWGIGSIKDDPQSWRRQTWRGYNWLGDILTETRDILMKEFPEECNLECSRHREHAAISYRAFSRPQSPFHMFYPANITLNGMSYSSAGQYMLYKLAELLEDGTVATEIMKTKEQQELMILQQKITLPSHLEQQWHEGLRRILHESNTAKFTSSDELQLKLINTGSDTIVYAAEETPLGINYRNHSFSSTHWHSNENWLGTTLMNIRDQLLSMKSSHVIPGLPVSSDERHLHIGDKRSTQRVTLNDRLRSAVEGKTSSKRSDKRQSTRPSSSNQSDKTGDFAFAEATSPFHLWYPVKVRIGNEDYESAGHYLVKKSLDMMAADDVDRYQIVQDATRDQDVSKAVQQFNIDQKMWHQSLQDELLYEVNDAKFDQHAELRQQLLDTGNERIVFVCKNDFFLGSGCDAQTLSDARTYSGRNRLGKSLMTLRLKLQQSDVSKKHSSGESPTAAEKMKKKNKKGK